MDRELDIDVERMEVVIATCNRFEQIGNVIKWVDIIISPERYPSEKPEVLKCIKDILMGKIRFQKAKLAGELEEEMVDIMAAKNGKSHGKHF